MKPRSTIWIVIWIILFFPIGLYLFLTNSNWDRRTKNKAILIAFVVFLLAIVFASIGHTNKIKPTHTDLVSKKPEATPLVEAATPTIVENMGLGITRSYVEESIQKAANAGGTSVNFKQGASIDNQDNYIAEAGQNVIQLIGPEDNLNEISSTALIGGTSQDDLLSLIYVIGVANIVDSNSKDWIVNTMQSDAQNGLDKNTNTKIINGKSYKLDMNSIAGYKSYSLTIDPQS